MRLSKDGDEKWLDGIFEAPEQIKEARNAELRRHEERSTCFWKGGDEEGSELTNGLFWKHLNNRKEPKGSELMIILEVFK
ncbi:hypothetical protein SLA2020_403100 [Shorea laevis]